MAARIPHRGAHDVGMVAGIGHADEVYVPRAPWVETMDSPLKKRTVEFDKAQFFADEAQKIRMKTSMRRFYTQELGRQVTSKKAGSPADFQPSADEKSDFRQSAAEDLARSVGQEVLAREGKERSRHEFRAGLDAQMAAAARRAQEDRQREAREAQEGRLRVAQALQEETEQRARRRRAMQLEQETAMRTLQDRNLRRRADQVREQEEVREDLRQQAIREELHKPAFEERMEPFQARFAKSAELWNSTTGKAEAAKRAQEDARLDRDEKRQQVLEDLHYSQREAARVRQQQRMVDTLRHQVEAKKERAKIPGIQKQMDRAAVMENTRAALEQELDKNRDRKVKERALQSDLITMMVERQQRDQTEGRRRPPAAATMAMTPALLSLSASGSQLAAATASFGARASSEPRLDLAKGYGVGGVVGSFGSEGSMRSGLMATGGVDMMSRSASLAARDRRMRSTWSSGLSTKDLRSGKEAAARRAAANSADKSNA